MIVINIEQGSEAWFQERCGRFTASKFSTLMSGKSTKGYKDLILDIAGEAITGEVEESYSNANMERGKDLEPEARQEFTELISDVKEVGFCLPDSDIAEWCGVSPDGMLPDGAILEIKCPLRKTHLNYLRNDRLPNEYKWQVQGQIFVTGAPYGYFMSYYPNMKPFILKVERDEQMITDLETRIKEAITEVKEIIKSYDIL